ncbi:MAG: hypothetical protein J6386_06035 [Candidatus Synoicihabitans palmerolidicus]|nr:hypothetical protein [Candidatus Synoicihabitans palmerolidicus]
MIPIEAALGTKRVQARMLTILSLAAAVSLPGQSLESGDAVEMSAMTVLSPRVANQEPVATVAMPVSALRFEPGVDVQVRNFAEGQADVALRGGTFANTGFGIEGLPLYDPQTGHYYAEVPVVPMMLTAPQIEVGADLAVGGGWNVRWIHEVGQEG